MWVSNYVLLQESNEIMKIGINFLPHEEWGLLATLWSQSEFEFSILISRERILLALGLSLEIVSTQ